MSSVTLVQTLTRTVDGYSVQTRVEAASGLPLEIFVYKESGEYSNVAGSSIELDRWPVSPATGIAFYRQREVTQIFADADEARKAAAVHTTSVSRLVHLINLRNRVAMTATLVRDFDEQTVVTYTSN